MNPKYTPGQTVYLSGANANLIEEAVVLKYSGGFYTIRFTKRSGGTRVREGRLYASRTDAERALPNRPDAVDDGPLWRAV